MDAMAKIRINSNGLIRNIEELVYYLKKNLNLFEVEGRLFGMIPTERFSNAAKVEDVATFLINKFELTTSEAMDVVNRIMATGLVRKKEFINGTWLVF